MRIAIYAGEIPSATFVEVLARELATRHEVCLFGTIATTRSHLQQLRRRPGTTLEAVPAQPIARVWFVLRALVRLLMRNPRELFRLLFHLLHTGYGSRLDRAAFLLPFLLHRPEIVHIQWAKSTERVFELEHFYRPRFVLSLRGTHINSSPLADPALAGTYRRFFPRVDRFHAVCRAIAREAERYGAPTEKIDVVYSGVDPALFERLEHRFPAGAGRTAPDDRVLELLSVGRTHWKKGYRYALEALARLRDDGHGFHYTIVAQGPPSEELLHHVADRGLSEHVTVLPGVDHSEVLTLIVQADALVLPSVEEGIANVVLEAMALGTPVVSSDCGGMPELVEDGVNGFLFPARSTGGLHQKLVALITLDPKTRGAICHRARERLRSGRLIQHTVGEMEAIYERAAGAANPAS